MKKCIWNCTCIAYITATTKKLEKKTNKWKYFVANSIANIVVESG